jgi:beta-N-acetylhexosaminidase
LIVVALRLAIAVALIGLALELRSPALAAGRALSLTGLAVLPLCLIAVDLRVLRSGQSGLVRGATILDLTLASAALLLAFWSQAEFHWSRRAVLSADPTQLEHLGRHVVIGFRNPDEARELAAQGAVAGFFVGAHNVRDRDAAEVRRDIAALQEARQQQGCHPCGSPPIRRAGSCRASRRPYDACRRSPRSSRRSLIRSGAVTRSGAMPRSRHENSLISESISTLLR